MRSDLETGNSGFGNYDLETIRSDLETGNSRFGNYDLEPKARDLESMRWKPWVGNYEGETFAGHSTTEKSNADFPLCQVFSTYRLPHL